MFENFFFMFLFFFLVHGDFRKDVEIVYGGDRAQISQDGSQVHLSLDQGSGSGFQSKNEFLFGKFDMQMKLVPGDSAGTVATCYLSSQGDTRNEIDFEFLGNVSGEPYILHTNIYIDGKDGREQQFYLWFDPREDFHTYSIIWNPHQILYSVDGTPVRVFKNVQGKGLPYPKDQPMRLYATIWNSTWATRGGLVQVDWNRAPFTASYRGYGVDACIWANGKTSCPSKKSNWLNQVLDSNGEKKLKLLQEKYMVYNYCTDTQRFHGVMPPECFVAS